MQLLFLSDGVVVKTEAYGKGIVDLSHRGRVKLTHAFFKAFFVDSADLFEQNYAVLGKTA